MSEADDDAGKRFRETQERYEREKKEARTKEAEEPETPPKGNGHDPDPNPTAEEIAAGDLKAEQLRQLRIAIGRLSEESTPEEVATIAGRIAMDVSDAIVREALVQTVKAQTKTPLRSLREQIDDIIKAERKAATQKSTRQVVDLRKVIAFFNERYSVVNESGKAWVFRWAFDPALKREVLERIRFSDFLRLYENEIITIEAVDGEEVTNTAAQFWLKSPYRQQYLGGVTFDPVGTPPDDYMNLWRGFAVEPKEGDWSLMREHIERVLCSGVPEWSDYVLDWSAYAVQHPNKPGEVALVFRGDEGCGKGTYGRWFAKLFGQHGLQIFSPEQLVGRFNEHLRDLIVLFGDEAFLAGDKKHEGILKGLITEPFLVVEGKGLKIVVTPNLLHVILSSNSKWVVPASAGARRYAVFDVPGSRVGNLDYFGKINKQMQNGGLAAMLYDLRERNISKFDVRKFPETDALIAQKKYSLDTISRWWLAVLERKFVWQSRFGLDEFSEWMEFCPTQLLYKSYLQWCGEAKIRNPETHVALGIWFTEVYDRSRPKAQHIIGELDTWPLHISKNDKADLIVKQYQPPGYKLKTLEEARARFVDVHKVHGDWKAQPEDE